MSADNTVTIIYGARDVAAEDITAGRNECETHCPLRLDMPDLAIFLSRKNAVRIVDQLTAALAAHKAAHDFHRSAGGAG